MIEIPRFTASELDDLVHLLGQEGVRFDRRAVTTRVGPYGGVTEYFLIIEREDFERTMDLLKDYLGIAPKLDEPFVGVCPACESEIDGSEECPECGLFLMVGTPKETKAHPFYRFLRDHDMLSK